MSNFIPQNREELGKLFELHKKTGLGAEIGVQTGYFSDKIAKFYTGKLLCVDLWGDEVVYFEAQKLLADKSKFDLMRGDSLTMARFVADESLDFVYIDANHHYKECLEDIEAWYPKVRSGGIISGHDFCFSDPDLHVIPAVHAFCSMYNYDTEKDLNIVCGESDYFNGKPYPSWWIVKR